jgi:16S rRNA (guanine(966)-N(2))-methyltransferase RsmD
MRVISGSARGKTLLSVPGDTTRPILDRVKKPLFDILRPTIEGTLWLDLFAGSGGVGIEALSEGAGHCTFTDLEPKAVVTIKKNLENTGLSTKAEVYNSDAFQFLRRAKKAYDYIYVAPPQYKGLWSEAMMNIAERTHLLSPRGRVIVQIDPKEYEELSLNTLQKIEERKYGKTLLVFYASKMSQAVIAEESNIQ